MVKQLTQGLRALPNAIKLVLLGVMFFIPFLGKVHLFDWDEINFAESAREMLLTDNYLTVQINFQPFWEKPPLFFWLQVLSMKAFGISEFAARFPNAIIGIMVLLTLYFVGKRLHDATFGWLWALAWLGSFTPHLYAKSGIIDPTFNYFMFLSIWQLWELSQTKSNKNALLAGLFMGLAVLTKGPVGILIPALTLASVWVWRMFRPLVTFWKLTTVGIIAILISAIWFTLNGLQNGWGIFEQFVAYQIRLFSTPDAGHEQPFFYHFLVVLLGCFPASIFAIPYLFSNRSRFSEVNKNSFLFSLPMKSLFWVVMILFTIVRTKIVHYSSMAYYPVTFFGALYLYDFQQNNNVLWSRWITVGLLFIGTLVAVLLTVLPLVGMYAYEVIPYINDSFAAANLQAPVSWAGWEWILGILYGIGMWALVRKRQTIKLFTLTAICLFAYTAIVVPKIEGYTQATPIDFYESHRDQDVYIETLGFKSYAHLYYFDKKPPQNPNSYDSAWLLSGKIDKPAYFVCRNIDAEEYRYNPNLVLIKEENGFVFFKRKYFVIIP